MKYWIISGIALIGIYAFYKAYQQSNIDPGLDALLRKGAVVLDVRTVWEYEGGHLPGAVNLPLGRLRQDCGQLDSSKTYITCCSHGLRSVKAVSLLKERGFRHVYNGGPWTELEQCQPDKH